MTPTPQEPIAVDNGKITSGLSSGDRIVISGMSGLFPQSHNIQEFSDLLYNKVDPSAPKTPRYSYNHPEMVAAGGLVPDLDTFDAQFFKVHYQLGKVMDPISRKLLEHAYQAIYDAGVNPMHLSGKKVGVYIGTCFSESEKRVFYESNLKTGLGVAGCSKTMFANRISYWLNAKGPSLSIDMACCSSTAALEQAYLAIRRGECEAAVVGGGYLCLHPQASVHYSRLIKLSKDGKTKSFDKNSDGCGKSEAINVLFLQKAKDSLRIYGELLHAKAQFLSLLENETGPKFGFDRNVITSTDFVKMFFEEVNIEPQAIEYVEAMGCGIPEVDKKELEVIEKVFCADKDDELFVGSVMSNIGYNEAALGLSAITKVLLGYHTGMLAANLNCENPRRDVKALREGRMRIVTEHQPFHRGLVAVNGFSVTGVNTHLLLHGNYKPKDTNKYKSNIPHLVTVSARQAEAVQYLLDNLKSQLIDPEQLALLHNIHSCGISGHVGRGYIILDTDESNKSVSLCERVDYFDTKRPLWFVYSGMGSQWTGMGTQLMRIPIFAAAIERCHQVLQPKGLNIRDIITSTDEKTFDNILHSFVGIAAIQIGLTDVLRAVGLEPDGIIGHSVGELGCAYADGCLSAEEMILAAYSRGMVSLETSMIQGSMAAVGMGYNQILQLCPPEIDVACHNSGDSSTISGPADVMHQFVAELLAQGVFAKEVPCSNIAYHSRYIAKAGPALLKYLKKVIKSPKARSKRWVSTSVPEAKWNEPAAQFCSPEYQTNNLLNPVLFEETTKHIPANAVLVEVAPHCLLQAILKRCLPSQCSNIPLTRRKHKDNVIMLLTALGEIFMGGFNMKLDALYPKVEFPVSTGTPFLSHLIQWAHGDKWPVATYISAIRKSTATCKHIVSYYDEGQTYLKGNVIRGKVLYPFAASLVLLWDTYAMILGVPKKSISVKFTNLQLYSQPILHDHRSLKLDITLHRGTGSFEQGTAMICMRTSKALHNTSNAHFNAVMGDFNGKILNGDSKVIRGYIQHTITKLQPMLINKKESSNEVDDVIIKTDDIYTLLRDRDYSYSGEFQSIHSVSSDFSTGNLHWNNNWVTLIDGMLQLNALRQSHDRVSVPSFTRSILIDIKEHHLWLSTQTENVIPAQLSQKYDYTRCGGVIMENIAFEHLPPNVALKPHHPFTEFKISSNGENSLEEKRALITGNYKLECTQIGDLETLNWVETPLPTQTKNSVTVQYVGINLDDMKIASGRVLYRDSKRNTFGMDFSGITNSGERVMGLLPTGAACRRVNAVPQLLWPVPEHWNLEDAATVPLAYSLAYYCCVIKFKLLPIHTVYVHGGCGALGQAVISLALSIGCKVLTSVSDGRKKQLLCRLFSELKEDNIGLSRDPNFSDFILGATHGVGCDLIINTAVGDAKNNATKACALSGWVIDLTQLQHRSTYTYGMSDLDRRSYLVVEVPSIFGDMELVRNLQALISHGISRGFVRPLTRMIYAPSEVHGAFRLLAASQHRGRVLVQLTDILPSLSHRLLWRTDATNVVICNEDTFGLRVADRLVSKGARNICIQFNNACNGYLLAKKRSWENKGVQVTVLTKDVSDEKLLDAIVEQVTAGELEGIYFVTKGNQHDKSHVESFDRGLRKLNINPKYFAVISVGDTRVAEDICRQRITMGFNAVNLLMPENKAMSNAETLDIVERALAMESSILTAAAPLKSDASDDLVQQVLLLSDISIPEDVNMDITLAELGLSSGRIPFISRFLLNSYNIAYDDNQISSLTINLLNQLQNELIPTSYEESKGWSNFFKLVGSDELLASTDIIRMHTLGNFGDWRGDEILDNQTNLYIFPGLEGYYLRFESLCERLKLPALVLQPSLECAHYSYKETARKITQVMIKNAGVKQNFYLLGYESGVILALEIAAILEDHGLTGTVFCLGYSPRELKQYFNEFISSFATDEDLENSLLKHLSTLISGTNEVDLLLNETTWESKVNSCVRGLLGRVSHSAQYTKTVITAALMRVRQLQSYNNCGAPARSLQSRIVLMRAGGAHMQTEKNEEDLQQYSLQELAVYRLTTPLADVAMDLNCANIINTHLDPAILKEFDNKNICNTYLLNATGFMGEHK